MLVVYISQQIDAEVIKISRTLGTFTQVICSQNVLCHVAPNHISRNHDIMRDFCRYFWSMNMS